MIRSTKINLIKMRYIICAISALLLMQACRKKDVHCMDIGNNLKAWTVYEPGDSIVMKDQFGNISVLKLSYNNRKDYFFHEQKGLVKAKTDCEGYLRVNDASNFFNLTVNSVSNQSGDVRYPTLYDIKVTVDGSMANMKSTDFNYTYPVNTPQGILADNYTSMGGTFYPQALVFNVDSAATDYNVYNFVYSKYDGLVEYSTKQPKRIWKRQ